MNRLRIILQYKYVLFILLLFVILLSFFRVNFNSKNLNLKNKNEFTGIISDYIIDNNKLSVVIKNKIKIKGTYYFDSNFDVNSIKLGIKVKVFGEINQTSNNTIFNGFNYKKYLSYNNIYYVINIDNLKIINSNCNMFYTIKNSFINYLNDFKSKNYLKALILNNKNDLDTEIKSTYQEMGISHIFTVSGMHISLLVFLLLKLFSKLKNKLKYFLIFVFLLFYLILTNFSPSILRSVILFILLYLNKEYDFNLETINVYLLSIIFILLFKPEYLFLTSFLYSGIVTFALINFNSYIKGNYFIKLFKVSFLAYMFSLPLTINLNYQINLLSIFYNLFYVPMISFVLYPLSLISLLIKPFDIILYFLFNYLEIISNNIFKINIIIPKLNVIFIVIYYFLIYLFFYLYEYKYLLLVILLLGINILIPYIDKNLYIYYLDVGQGDSILLKEKNICVLIDTGGSIYANNSYYKTDNSIKFFKSIGCYNLDYFITTHGDTDHMGESIHLINNFKVNKVIFNCGAYNDLENELIKILESKNIKFYSCINELKIDKNNKLVFLNTGIYDNENDNSNVIYLNYNNLKFLFMGDASVEREKDLLNKYNLKDITFLKVGHHGSNTSSSDNFIKSINPKYSIISVGKNNRYGHPKESVLNILKNNNSKVYRTDTHGSIEININENGYSIETCSP